MTLLKEAKNYQLRGHVKPYGDLFDVTLEQRFPEGRNPRWQRILQLNLNEHDLDVLTALLLKRNGT